MVGASYRFRIKPGMTEVGMNPEVRSNDIGGAAIGKLISSMPDPILLKDSKLPIERADFYSQNGRCLHKLLVGANQLKFF
jgi:hypothetical protein